MTPRRTRVLVCEDSKTYAAALTRSLEHDGEIEVVAVAASAEEAVAQLRRLEPDLVTMDMELPGAPGISAVEAIMAERPTPILVLSAHVAESGSVAAAAVAAGALEAIGKADLTLADPTSTAATALVARVKVLSRARVIRHPRALLQARRPPARPAASYLTAIGIAASTGGPQALASLLSGLPARFDVPILVVQHIAPGFLDGFVRWLNATVALPVRLGEHNTRPLPGVTVAPEGADLVLTARGILHLDATASRRVHRPSGDVLLRSIARAAGGSGAGVVLTGMGSDGAQGLAAVREAGGLTIAQDEATSALYGMPREAARHGAARILPLGEIAAALAAYAPTRAALR